MKVTAYEVLQYLTGQVTDPVDLHRMERAKSSPEGERFFRAVEEGTNHKTSRLPFKRLRIVPNDAYGIAASGEDVSIPQGRLADDVSDTTYGIVDVENGLFIFQRGLRDADVEHVTIRAINKATKTEGPPMVLRIERDGKACVELRRLVGYEIERPEDIEVVHEFEYRPSMDPEEDA